MKNLITYSTILILMLNLASFGQSSEQVNLQIRASLKRGISVESENNILNFGEIVLSRSQQTITKSPQEGLRFKIITHPDKPVLIDFNVIHLNSNENQNGPDFIPEVVHTGSNVNFINPVEVQPGTYYQPEAQDGDGILNVWVGGSLIIKQSNLQGDYSGTLIISIAY